MSWQRVSATQAVLAAWVLVGFSVAQAQANTGAGKVTPPVLTSGSSTVTADTVLTPEQEKTLLNAEDQILHFVSKVTHLDI